MFAFKNSRRLPLLAIFQRIYPFFRDYLAQFWVFPIPLPNFHYFSFFSFFCWFLTLSSVSSVFGTHVIREVLVQKYELRLTLRMRRRRGRTYSIACKFGSEGFTMLTPFSRFLNRIYTFFANIALSFDSSTFFFLIDNQLFLFLLLFFRFRFWPILHDFPRFRPFVRFSTRYCFHPLVAKPRSVLFVSHLFGV